MSDVCIESVSSNADLARICGVMSTVFGSPVPHPVDLRSTLLAGGFCAIAHAGGRDLGALCALAGWDAAGPFQHSNMLAVCEEHRGQGLGETLKRFHADWCLARAVPRIRWTFDPLMPGNARFNLERLGAVGDEWVEDCYGSLPGVLDPLERTGADAPSDRLHVTWYLDGAPAPPSGGEVRVAIPPTGDAPGALGALEAVLALRGQLAPRLACGGRAIGVVAVEGGWAYRVALPEGVS